MKSIFILLLFISLAPVTSWAQTPVSKAQAQKFYEACATNRDERMSTKTQDAFCQCSARGYYKHITQEDLTDLRTDDQRQRNAMNKLALELYAPCMEHPIRDMVYNKCTKDAYQAGQKICRCMATKMANYTATRAQAELATILKNNPNVSDPLHAITHSKAYEAQEKRIVMQCIQGK